MQGMHIHLSFIGALTSFIGVIIFGFFWRLLSMSKHDTPLGQAMAFIY